MNKHTVVALALFAGLISTQAFAQDLVITSAKLKPTDPNTVVLEVANQGRVAACASGAEVKFFGPDMFSMLRDGAGLIAASGPCVQLAPSGQPGDRATLEIQLLWSTPLSRQEAYFAKLTGKGSPVLYFKAKIDCRNQVTEQYVMANNVTVPAESNNSLNFTFQP